MTADRDLVCLVASKFRLQLNQRREEILLSSVHWWRPNWFDSAA
jgi:hypothetical protein